MTTSNDPPATATRRQTFRHLLKTGATLGTAGLLACVATTPAKANWQHCSKCSCVEFKEDYRNNNICENCGHTFGDHW